MIDHNDIYRNINSNEALAQRRGLERRGGEGRGGERRGGEGRRYVKGALQLGPKFKFSSVLATNLEDCTGITSRCGKRHNRAASPTEAPLPIWIPSSCRIVTLKVFQHLDNYKYKLTTENSLDARHFSGRKQHFLNNYHYNKFWAKRSLRLL